MRSLKKLGLLFAVLMLVVSLAFAGCAQDVADEPEDEVDENGEEISEPSDENGELADGVYRAASEAGPRSYTEAFVTIENGDIVDVALYEYDARGLKKGIDFVYNMERWAEADEDLPEEFEVFQDVTDALEEMILEANSYEIDIISGATGSSNSAMDAVERALGMARGETGPFDGTFMGVSDEGVRSWGIAWVTVEGGEIVDVRLEEAGKPDAYAPAAEAQLKDEDYGWDEFHEAKEVMPEWFIEANSHDVDNVTGATSSADSWKQAVARALANAGVYERAVGYSEDSRGFVRAELILDNGDFVDVSLIEYDNRGLRKEIDYQYDVERWADARDDYPEEYESLRQMHDELVERFMEANSTDIDIITGATSSTNKSIEAVENALAGGPHDGTFMGLSSRGPRGWGIAIVTFQNGEIVDVVLEEVGKSPDDPVADAELKGEDYAKGSPYWDEEDETTPFHEAKEVMPERFIEADDVTQVDNVTEATGSVDKWIEAVLDAKRKAGLR